jgi:nitroreductase
MNMNGTLDVIKARRSIREFASHPVSDEQMQALLEAAMAAPSASNRRPWEFVVVRDVTLRQALSEIHPWSSMTAHSPVVVAVCGQPGTSRHWVEDCAAATANLLLAVTALGLGAVWVALYPEAERQTKVRQILRIPDSVEPFCLVPIGYPAQTKPPQIRFDAAKVHHGFF